MSNKIEFSFPNETGLGYVSSKIGGKEVTNFMSEVRFLGYDSETLSSYIYSDLTKSIVKVNIDKFDKRMLSALMRHDTVKTLEDLSLVITDYDIDNATVLNINEIVNRYSKEIKKLAKNNKDKELKPSYAKIALFLLKVSISSGVLNIDNINGSGVFINNGKILINSGEVFSVERDGRIKRESSRVFSNYLGGKVVFEYNEDLGFNSNVNDISKETLLEVYNVLNTFSFDNREQDVDLILGWICHAYFSGALNWRTHLSITGSRGSGKSVLLSFMNNLLGKFSIKAEGDSTESGIRQRVKKSAKAILLDESEADGKKIARNLALFRSSSSGSTVLRGTSDQNGVEYQLKIAGCIAGIVPPVFNAADASRFIQITMSRAKGKEMHDFLEDYNKDNVNIVGLSLFSFLVKNYFKVMEVQKAIKSFFIQKGKDGRFIETNSYILSFSYFVKNFAYGDLDLYDFLNQFDFSTQEEMNEEKDENKILDFIVSRRFNLPNSRTDLTLINICSLIDRLDDVNSDLLASEGLFALNTHGINVKKEFGKSYLYIDTNDFGFKSKLGDKKDYDIIKVLLRCEGVEVMQTASKDGRVKLFRGDKNRKASNIVIIDLDMFFSEVKEIQEVKQEVVQTKAQQAQPVVKEIQEVEVKQVEVQETQEVEKTELEEIIEERVRELEKDIINEFGFEDNKFTQKLKEILKEKNESSLKKLDELEQLFFDECIPF